MLVQHAQTDSGSYLPLLCLLQLLASFGEDARESAPILLELAGTRDDVVGEAAIGALVDIGVPDTALTIIGRMKKLRQGGGHEGLVAACIRAIGKAGRDAAESVTVLAEVIRRDSEVLKAAAVDALGQIGSDEAIAVLVEVGDSQKALSFLRFGDSKYLYSAELRERANQVMAARPEDSSRPFIFLLAGEQSVADKLNL